jgi:hypothetical protein
MLKLRNIYRLSFLSSWQPPPGVRRALIVYDDGRIDVLLSAGEVRGVVAIPPAEPLDRDVYRALGVMADRLLASACLAGSREEQRRIQAALAPALRRFLDGLVRAANGGAGHA